VGTQAADGMRLDRSYASTGSSLKDLDAPEAFEKHAVTLIASLADCARRRWWRRSITGRCC
jgi:hypothetical protein